MSFKSHDTELIWKGIFAKRLPTQIQEVIRRKLRYIDAAEDLDDLRTPPGNRLECLKGDLKGLYSIRVNDQWRILFSWQDNDAHDVELIDYH